MISISDENCIKFINDPTINPITRRKIIITGKVAKMFIDKCINKCQRFQKDSTINPYTNRKIVQNKSVFNKISTDCRIEMIHNLVYLKDYFKNIVICDLKKQLKNKLGKGACGTIYEYSIECNYYNYNVAIKLINSPINDYEYKIQNTLFMHLLKYTTLPPVPIPILSKSCGNYYTLLIMEKTDGQIDKYFYSNLANIQTTDHIVAQIICIYAILEKIGFVHKDLHLNNVMFRKLKTKINLTFKVNTIRYIIKTDILVLLSDFDSSETKMYRNNYVENLLTAQKNTDMSKFDIRHPFFDIFKILLDIKIDKKIKKSKNLNEFINKVIPVNITYFPYKYNKIPIINEYGSLVIGASKDLLHTLNIKISSISELLNTKFMNKFKVK